MTKDEALKLALEALKWSKPHADAEITYNDAITAIKEALAQPEQLREENERLHVENRRLIDRIETIGVPVGVGGFATTTSVQPEQEPVAWEGGEGWESLAWELCADENGEDSCNELIWEGGPIPEPWGDHWMKYEEEAKRLIALVQKHTTPPQRKPLSEEEIGAILEDVNAYGTRLYTFARAIEAAHGITGEKNGTR